MSANLLPLRLRFPRWPHRSHPPPTPHLCTWVEHTVLQRLQYVLSLTEVFVQNEQRTLRKLLPWTASTNRLLMKWHWVDEIKYYQTGWKCSTRMSQGKIQQNFDGKFDENPLSRPRHVIILKWILKIKQEAGNWIHFYNDMVLL
jgi:hypothetical protein